MAYYEQLPVGELTLSNKTAIGSGTPTIFAGNKTTRATLILEIPKTAAIGSIYLSTAGKIYLKVANTATPAATDWQKVTTSAAD